MVKKLIPFIALLLIGLIGVSAQSIPHPIYGNIYLENYKIDGIDVMLKDLNTGEVVYAVTDSSGFYQFELGNMQTAYPRNQGHDVEITACRDAEGCVKTIRVDGSGGQRVDFKVGGNATISYGKVAIPVGVVILLISLGLWKVKANRNKVKKYYKK